MKVMFNVARHHCEVLQLDKCSIKLRIAVRYCEPRTAASKVSVLGVGRHEVLPPQGSAQSVK
jgi:hypothetical protein